MFWKKKISRSELFRYETDSKRQFIRVLPSEDRPIPIHFDDHEKQAITISADGLSFQNRGYSRGDAISVTISLPEYPKAISVSIIIVDICRYDRCHCHFTDIDEEHRELIHQYCLARQKEMISLSRKKARKETPTGSTPFTPRRV